MRAPIIVNNHGDLMVFGSKEDVERYLEAIAVANGEYVAYDSEGRLLQLIPAWPHSATVLDGESEPNHRDDLKALLVNCFLKLDLPAEQLGRGSLEELIDKAKEFKLN